MALQQIVLNCANEEDMLKAISIIMGNAGSVPTVPAPQELLAEFEEASEKPVTCSKTTADIWKEMVIRAATGKDAKIIRESLGFTQTELAKRWGCSPESICMRERNNGKLRHSTKMKLAKIVMDRIAELS